MQVAPSLKSSDTALLLLDRYDTTYGIYNHDRPDPDRPLALVAMHTAENASVGSTLYERIDQFADLQVPKHFGLSLTEFFDFPTDICNKILEVSSARKKREEAAAEQALSQLGNKKP